MSNEPKGPMAVADAATSKNAASGWGRPLRVWDIIGLLDSDVDPRSGWLRNACNALDGSYKAGDIAKPLEVCLRTQNWWVNVRASGHYVSWFTSDGGWDQLYPRGIAAWLIRRAVARWVTRAQTAEKSLGITKTIIPNGLGDVKL